MRVIQDSDDELEEDIEYDNLSRRAADNAEAYKRPGVTLEVDTGSTESLKRVFAEAHRSHLQALSAPSAETGHSGLPLSTAFEQKDRSRDASNYVRPRTSEGYEQPVKCSSTYGRSNTFNSNYPENLIHDESATAASRNDLQTSDASPWQFEDTDCGKHAPRSPVLPFSAPSSTVPNATLTQQRVLEHVEGPLCLDSISGVEVQSYHPSPEASVPWSDIMKFTPAEVAEQLQPLHQQAYDGSTAPLHRSSKESNQDTNPQHVQGSFSVGLENSPMRAKLTCGYNSSKEPAVLYPHASSSTGPRLSPTELQCSLSNTAVKTHRLSDPDCMKGGRHADDENDFLVVDSAQEQYKSRPSRLKSAKTSDLEKPSNSAVKPEKTSRVTRRRRTTNNTANTDPTDVADSATTPQKVQQICEMGFTPLSTRRALRENNGEITKTVDWLISNGMSEDELALHNTPRKKSKVQPVDRSYPVATEHSLDSHAFPKEEVMIRDQTQCLLSATAPDSGPSFASTGNFGTSGATVHCRKAERLNSPTTPVGIPVDSLQQECSGKRVAPINLSSKMKRSKTTSDVQPDSPMPEFPIAPDTIKEKKRGRGRPRKTPKTELALDTPHDIGPEDGDRVVPAIQPKTVGRDSKGTESDMAATPDQSRLHAAEDYQGHSSVPVSLPDKSPAAICSTSEPSIPLQNRSPANKGKAAYRVGLSKRAKIAPLLRTLKK